MNSHSDNLATTILQTPADKSTSELFMSRISEGLLTRDENPQSHLCVYFAAYCTDQKSVFIGHHRKSGLWLFNGGHIDKNESLMDTLYREMDEEWGFVKRVDTQTPSLLTITQIENPMKQVCKIHYDVWFFIPFDRDEFKPNDTQLVIEFFSWGWKSIHDAHQLIKDSASLRGLEEIKRRF